MIITYIAKHYGGGPDTLKVHGADAQYEFWYSHMHFWCNECIWFVPGTITE